MSSEMKRIILILKPIGFGDIFFHDQIATIDGQAPGRKALTWSTVDINDSPTSLVIDVPKDINGHCKIEVVSSIMYRAKDKQCH
jgi:hypothetical protein